MAVVIKSDGLDEWVDGLPLDRDWTKLEGKEIVDLIKQAGVVGCGGATFPAHGCYVGYYVEYDFSLAPLQLYTRSVWPYVPADDYVRRIDCKLCSAVGNRHQETVSYAV